MYDHVKLPVSDLGKSRQFYEQALAPFGLQVMMEMESTVIYTMESGALFAITESGQVAPVHVAFQGDRGKVHEFYDAALAAGGKDNGAPGPRPHYHENYYGAFVHDPDGHNIETVSHKPE